VKSFQEIAPAEMDLNGFAPLNQHGLKIFGVAQVNF